MSKGWYVKVGTQIVINIDTNIGVVASTEEQAGVQAQNIVLKDLSINQVVPEYLAELSDQIPWEFDLAGMHWCRSGSPNIDFDTMQALSVTPDSDFDPDEPDAGDLMDAAMCLLEAFWELPEDDKRKSDFLPNHGIAVVRDQMASAAGLCHQTWMLVNEEDGADCFDWDFCPQFLDRCMDEQMVVKSNDLYELQRMWKGD